MTDRKTDGGKGDRIPGANQSAYEAGYAGIQWGDGVDGKPCVCGLASCVEPWEPGCGLGNSMEHARAAD